MRERDGEGREEMKAMREGGIKNGQKNEREGKQKMTPESGASYCGLWPVDCRPWRDAPITGLASVGLGTGTNNPNALSTYW